MSETTTATATPEQLVVEEAGNGLFPVPPGREVSATSESGIGGTGAVTPPAEAAPAMPALDATPPGTTDDTSNTSAASGKLDDPATWGEKKDERNALQTTAQNPPPKQPPLHERAFGALKGALGFGGGSETPTTPIVAPTPDHLTINPASGALETPVMPNVAAAPEATTPLNEMAGTTPGMTTETDVPEPGSETTRPMSESVAPAFELRVAATQPEAVVDAVNATQKPAATEDIAATQTAQAEGPVAAVSDNTAGAVLPGAENPLLSQEATGVVADASAPEAPSDKEIEAVSPPPFDANALAEQPSASATGAPLPLEVRPDQANEVPPTEGLETSAEEIVDPLAVVGPTMPEPDHEESPTAPIEPALQTSAGEAGSASAEVVSEVPENVIGIRPDTAIEPTPAEPASAVAGMAPTLSVVPPTEVPAEGAENDPNSGVGNPPAMPQAA
ncbi:MAG: hypothetical protein Q7T54_05840 [Candidatus Levybacteria bacterium]|nr:hypothetical protein [Candidatus Levybacteria bacterium]